MPKANPKAGRRSTGGVSRSQQRTQPQKEGPGATAAFLPAGLNREHEKRHSWPSVRSHETVSTQQRKGEEEDEGWKGSWHGIKGFIRVEHRGCRA